MSNLTSEQQLLIATAWVDGRLDDAEADLIRRLLRSARMPEAEIQASLSPPGPSLDVLLGNIPPGPARLDTMRLVLQMCFVDDILEFEEFDLIERAARHLGIDAETMEQLRQEANRG
jgi:uncharacterized tellurite resistance protein B-like protein